MKRSNKTPELYNDTLYVHVQLVRRTEFTIQKSYSHPSLPLTHLAVSKQSDSLNCQKNCTNLHLKYQTISLLMQMGIWMEG